MQIVQMLLNNAKTRGDTSDGYGDAPRTYSYPYIKFTEGTHGYYSALRIAAENGYLDIFRTLANDYRFNSPQDMSDALTAAAVQGKDKIVEYLVRSKQITKDEDNAALIAACVKGYEEIVRVLLNLPGMDPSAYQNRAIGAALERRKVKVAKILLADRRVREKFDFAKAIEWATDQNLPDFLILFSSN